MWTYVYMHWETKKLCDCPYFQLSLLWWSEIKPAISLRPAYRVISFNYYKKCAFFSPLENYPHSGFGWLHFQLKLESIPHVCCKLAFDLEAWLCSNSTFYRNYGQCSVLSVTAHWEARDIWLAPSSKGGIITKWCQSFHQSFTW